MTHTFSSKKSSRTKANESERDVAGSHGVAVAPPAYGVDFVDRESLASREAPVQFQATTSVGLKHADIHKTAASGVQGPGHALPHFDKIQNAFGKHDLRHVQAYNAPAAAHAIGAEAYTTQNKVAFTDRLPSLHTAAHEAAHVVQQRDGIQLHGGVGAIGDPYERHADAVADQVVQGKSVERLLDTVIGSSSHSRIPKLYYPYSEALQFKFDKTVESDLPQKTIFSGVEPLAFDSTIKSKPSYLRNRYEKVISRIHRCIQENNLENRDRQLSIAPDAQLEVLLYRLEGRTGDAVFDYPALVNALIARGAILVNGSPQELSTDELNPMVEKRGIQFTINLIMPGSGDQRWRTKYENMLEMQTFTGQELMKKVGTSERKELGVTERVGHRTFFKEKETKREVSFTIRGPGGLNKMSTHPSNSIGNNVDTAKQIVDYYCEQKLSTYGEGILVRIKGHSRNAVATSKIAKALRAKYPVLHMDVVMFDPVPGSDTSGDEFQEIELPKDITSTLVYSLNDDRTGFAPQVAFNAERLILTHYGHHAGIEPGFMYYGVQYKGDLLNLLPPGLYYDEVPEEEKSGEPHQLIGPFSPQGRPEVVEQSAKEIAEVINKAKGASKKRKERIRKVVKAFGLNVDKVEE